MTINRSKTSNKFCGPAAIASLTGVHVDEAAYALRVATGRRAIKGVRSNGMVDALKLLGYSATQVKLEQVTVKQPVPHARAYGITIWKWRKPGKRCTAPTLVSVLRTIADRKPEDKYLVIITGHYVTIQGRKLYDTKHPEGIFLGQCPYRRRRVRGLWLVAKEGEVTLPPKPMTLSQFTQEIEDLGYTLYGDDIVDAPAFMRFFHNDTHCLAVTGTYEEMLEQLRREKLVECPQDCECRD